MTENWASYYYLQTTTVDKQEQVCLFHDILESNNESETIVTLTHWLVEALKMFVRVPMAPWKLRWYRMILRIQKYMVDVIGWSTGTNKFVNRDNVHWWKCKKILEENFNIPSSLKIALLTSLKICHGNLFMIWTWNSKWRKTLNHKYGPSQGSAWFSKAVDILKVAYSLHYTSINHVNSWESRKTRELSQIKYTVSLVSKKWANPGSILSSRCSRDHLSITYALIWIM